MRVSDEQVAHTIRFPYGMHRKLKELAEKKNRSFNSQIVWLLKLALDEEKKKDEIQD